MRRILILLFSLSPVLASAQSAGGEVRRHDKRKEPVKEVSARKQKSLQTTMSESQRQAIIQNLINNMVYVEGGTFMMGATSEQGDKTESNEKPTHKVTLSSFSIGKYEVTQEEWQAVMGVNPPECKGRKRPVQNICWDDCREFINKLNVMTGRRFRLPTEAEWEYAARGGNKSHGYKYSGSDNLDIVAWYGINSGKTPHDVGKKKPNELGLYDMSGNVEEWCQDRYNEYRSDSQTNPLVDYSGSRPVDRVRRGGNYCCGWDSWTGRPIYNNEQECRISFRSYALNYTILRYTGLRLAW